MNLTTLLALLDGKKASIAASIGLCLAYMATKGIIGEAEVAFIGGLNIIFFGGAEVITPSYLGMRRKY
jgi:hypothetical protein